MKIAVLANEKDSFVRPLAEGLARMATGCGADPEIHYDGLEILSLPLGMRWRSPRAVASSALKAPGYRKRFHSLVERLGNADLIVVVAHVPGSLSRHTLGNVEALRERLPGIPVVNYDLVYLPTVEKWGAAMLRGDLSDISAEEMRLISPPPFGLERYDWYLVASAVSEIAMPSGPHPCSHIGMDIDDGTLFPDQDDELHVLVDFEQTRKDYSSFREIQLAALERSGTSFEVLEGRFTRDEIREKYRKAGALMLAHRESFGLPIVELQACGGLIFTPKAEWAGAHWIKDDVSVPGHGEHTSNFVVYENTVDALVGELEEAKRSFDPVLRRKTFRREHPHFFRGDREVFGGFLDRVKSGKIHSRLHLEHAGIGRDG